MSDLKFRAAAFYKEVEGLEVLETDEGFVTFSLEEINGERVFYARDAYVLPEHREKHVVRGLFDTLTEIAKDAGVSVLVTSIRTNILPVTRNLKVVLSYDFEFYFSTDKAIFFRKVI